MATTSELRHGDAVRNAVAGREGKHSRAVDLHDAVDPALLDRGREVVVLLPLQVVLWALRAKAGVVLLEAVAPVAAVRTGRRK